jgi:hypothetical protein
LILVVAVQLRSGEWLDVIGIETAAALAVAWVLAKAGRVGKRVDAEVDEVLDAGMDRLHDTVVAKLGTGTAVALQTEARVTGKVSDEMRERVTREVREAAAADPVFADEVQRLVRQIEARSGMTVLGNVTMTAGDGSVVAGSIGSVTIGGERPRPSQPGQLQS